MSNSAHVHAAQLNMFHLCRLKLHGSRGVQHLWAVSNTCSKINMPEELAGFEPAERQHLLALLTDIQDKSGVSPDWMLVRRFYGLQLERCEAPAPGSWPC